jgi:hypothetical protein
MPITRRKRANPPDDDNNNAATNESNNGASSTGSAEELASAPAEQTARMPAPVPEEMQETPVPVVNLADTAPFPPVAPIVPGTNGSERQDYSAPIEGGRRTPRGELFRRAPQVPPATPASVPAAPSVQMQAQAQPPTREMGLPLGNLLHLAYNPAYTGADEARSALLRKLAHESKSGARSRCWNCGSIAISYDCWNTRSKTFGEVGVAFCEVCGAWSVL